MRYLQSVSIGILFLLILLVPAVSHGLTVTNLNDAGAGSLRDAVANTAAGGTVDFAVTGTIVLASEIEIDKDITIQGPGADMLTVSGGNTTRVFNITAGTNIKINDIRIADGFVSNDTSGGAAFYIHPDNLNMELNDCIVENNTSLSDNTQAAGVISLQNFAGSAQFFLKVQRCSFINNVAQAEGAGGVAFGAVFFTASGRNTLEVYDSLFKGNRAEGSVVGQGGVLLFGSLLSNYKFKNTTFESNVARGDNVVIGGVVGDGSNNNTFDCTNCTFYDNRAECGDGDCTFVAGGAIGSGADSNLNCNFCTFKSNRAVCAGNNCAGGGDNLAAAANPNISIANSIIYSDNPENSCFGDIVSLGYNIDNGSSCIDGTVVGDKPNTDPDLDPLGLQNNGGPTETIAILDFSPAVDMANPACPPPDTDQRGVLRPQGPACDIGAYERIVSVVRPIPTLSEWGLIAMAGILGVVGLLAIRRRKAAL